MDSNEILATLRQDVQEARADIEIQGYVNLPDVRKILSTFWMLDMHLSGGGTPPEAWREGPDAPELDVDGYPWCYLCGMVFSKGRDTELDAHLRTAHGPDPLGPPDPAGVELPEAGL